MVERIEEVFCICVGIEIGCEELDRILKESAKPLSGSAAGLLSRPESRISHACPRPAPAVAGDGLFDARTDAKPDLYAFTGCIPHGELSRESIRPNASFPGLVAAVGVVSLPRRIGAMASSTFSRA